MKNILSSKVVTRSFAIILSVAMIIAPMQTSLYVQAVESNVSDEGNSTVDIALQATATANAEHSNWGILAENMNNGHEPTSSSDNGGSWHDYGIESTDGTSWVQYDWNVEVTVDSMSVYWMCDGTWADRIPKSAKVEYKDASGTWQTVATYDVAVMVAQAADQYNKLALDKEITTKCIRMTMVRNTADQFCSIHRWQVWGQASEAPILEDATVTEITDGYRLTNKYFVVETGKYGQITSLKLQGDTYPTNYVMNAKNASAQNTAGHQWLGELMFHVKVGDALVYTEENTNKSDSGRKIELVDNKVVITYENATGDKAIKDFKVVETYSLVKDKLRWDITVTNTNEQKLTIGDFGIPMAFNEFWTAGDQIYETRTVDHSFVGLQSSYIYVTRPSGVGQFLLLTPDTSTGAGFEYQDHWRTSERASDEQAWCQDQSGWQNGLNVFYIHSDNIKKTKRGYLENTTLDLAAGESKTYSFHFSAVENETDMKTTLYEEGVIDAVAVPGMTYSVNMPGKLYLHTAINKDDISFDIQCPHETGLHTGDNTVSNMLTCKKTEENTYVKYEKTITVDGEQYHVYEIHFTDLGQNNVIVKYNSGASETVLQFYMMDDVATALETHADFMVEKTQWNNNLDVSDKVFDDWMLDTKNKRGETDANYWLKNYWGWGDDWGLTHGEYIAEKNVYQPVTNEITAVDEYLDIAIWNGLMREHQKDYLIHDFLMEAPNSSPTYRGYAYPHIYNTYFSMYKIASKYPGMIDYVEDANTYLLRAFNILKALYGSTVSYNYNTGLMGEQTTPDLIAALEKEGYYTEAQAITVIMAEKYNNFKDTKYPYGSEYSYDNTGEEAVYTLAKLNNATDTANSNMMMSKINLKTRACRGLQPLWYQYANPVTNCGENWWQFQYTASLAGFCMDDWIRVEDNGLTETERAIASRVNYAAKLANLTSINSGQIDADPANIGAVAWTYQSEMGNLGGQGTGGGKLHNGWRQMSGEADLGLYGALQILSSDVVIDPVFGLFGYGCNVTDNSGIYLVTPLDGLFTRLNLIKQELYLELDRDQYTQAQVAEDNSSIQLSMKNLEGTAHNTDINITGLNAGSYQVSVNGIVVGSFQAVVGKTSTVTLPLPAAATATVSIENGAALENKVPEVTLAASKTVAISEEVRLEANATDDGYVNNTLTYQWEVVKTPEGGEAILATATKHITNVTFSLIGEYVFKFTANDGALSSSKEITVTVTENQTLPEMLVNYTFNDGTVIGTNKLLVNSNTGFDYAELDDNSVLVEGKDGKGISYTGRIAEGYVELPEALTKNLTKATISMDVNLTASQSNKTTLFEFGDNVVVEFADGNELIMSVNGNTAHSGVIFATGYWKNVELTVDGDDYALYVDGVKKVEFKDTGLALADIDTEVMRYLIGRSKAEADPFLKGTIDNFVVRSIVMTEEQLINTYGVGEHTLISGKAGSIVTTLGVAPVLPAAVFALYSDGVYEKVGIAWDTVDPSNYTHAGTFNVNGNISGTDITVTYKVIVAAGTLQNVAGDATPSAIIDTPSDLGGVKGLNDGFDPANSRDTSHGVWHNWRGSQGSPAWVQYNWETEQIISGIDAYFFKDGGGNFAPANYSIEYLKEDGNWYSLTNAVGLGVEIDKYNNTSFDAVSTKGIRMTLNPAALGSGVIEWKVYGYKDGAVLDKAALNTAIATAEGLKSSLFTAGMDAVTTTLTLAKAVVTDKEASQKAIDAAAFALNTAISSLTPVVENNLAYMASVTTSFTSSWERTSAVNDGAVSSVSNSSECTHWGTWGNESAYESVTYSWGIPMKISTSDIYLWTDGGGILVPSKYVYEYLDKDGTWKEVTNAVGYEVLKLRTNDPAEEPNLDGFNTTTFDEVTTTAFRVSVYKGKADGEGVGLVEWRVFGTKLAMVESPIIITNPVDTTAVTNGSIVSVTIASVSGSAIIAQAVSGSAIYYTLNGADPDSNATLYNSEFTISTSHKTGETLIIKAIEFRVGWLNSKVVQKQVIFLPAQTEPTPTPIPTGVPSPIPTTIPSPTTTPTPTPIIENIPEGENNASASLSILVSNGIMSISVQLNAEQLKKLLDGAAVSDKDVLIPIITQNIISQMNKEITQLNITAIMPKDLLANRNIDHANVNLPAELLKAAKEAGIDINVSVKDETGKEMYSWSFAGQSLQEAKGDISEINLSLTVGAIIDHVALNKLLSGMDDIQNGLSLRFNHDGILPAQASVRIYVGNLVDIRNRTIYLYHYNPDTGKLETLPYCSNYYVDSEGYITINVLHCSDYVVLTKAANKDVTTSLLEQIVISPTKKTLYVGGTQGFETSIKVMLPPTLEVVSSLRDQTSGSAVGAVVFTYKSTNSKVATVDNKGKIIAVGVGTTYIITTIKLYNNKSTSVRTKITVKEPYINFTSSIETMKVGEGFTFKVKAYGVDMDIIIWRTTKKSILVINQNGKAIAKSKGTDYVKVQIGNVIKKIKVIVK